MISVPDEESEPAPTGESDGTPALSGTAGEAAGHAPAASAGRATSAGPALHADLPAQPIQAPPAPIPAESVVESYALHPAAPRLWAWSHALVILVFLVPAALAGGVWQGPRALVAIALLAALAWSVVSRYLRLAVGRFRCERFASGLRYRHGVWWQSEVFIPAARVQHTEVNQGPIARRFGIGRLKVFTAAVQLGALEIDGLAYADALLLRDRLLGRQDEAGHGAPPSAPTAGERNA